MRGEDREAGGSTEGREEEWREGRRGRREENEEIFRRYEREKRKREREARENWSATGGKMEGKIEVLS